MDESREQTRTELSEIKRQARIDAQVKVVQFKEDPHEALKSTSSTGSDFVFIGMGATDGAEAIESIKNLLPKLESPHS